MNILNGNEAFAALMAGKKLMCRAVGGLIEFDDLDQFPATIFAMPGYEFSIKIDLIEVAGITFTKPLTLDEYQDGQDVFVICTYSPSVYVVNFKTSALIESINSGFVQRDAENAKLQLQAMCKALGRELDGDCSVVRLGEDPNKPEKKRQSRKKTDTSVTIAEVEPSCVESEDTPWETAVDTVTKETKHAFTVDDVEVIEEDPLKIVEKFTAQINACATTDSALKLRHSFAANGHLDDTHVHHLMKLVEDKCLELDPEQYAPKIEIISQENVTTSEDSLVDNTPEITDFNQPSIVNLINTEAETELKVAQLKEEKYQNLLGELLDRAEKSKTPTEANALYKYTMQWTEEQRKPLMRAITKRLQELDQQKEAATEQPPSLMVQIQNALDLTALDVLEIDVASRHPDIQPKLMDLVKKRRFELENQGSQVAS